jgi:hypothetical protein
MRLQETTMRREATPTSARSTSMWVVLGAALAFAAPAPAHEATPSTSDSTPGGGAEGKEKPKAEDGAQKPVRADSHAPIGVIGDHMHKQGEWMLSYRFMHMDMDGSLIGENNVSPGEIASFVPNYFPVVTPRGASVVPPTLRIVPARMPTDMHMLGAMYAPIDDITLMAMIPVIEKNMDHITYAPTPPRNANAIGGFTTSTGGIGDVSLTGLFRLYEEATEDSVNHVHLNMGVAFPTGSIGQYGSIYDSFGRSPLVKLPYAMQIGSGTYDLLPGLTYTGRYGNVSWGAQYRAEIRLGRNWTGYAFGDRHLATGWLAYQFIPAISASFRAQYTGFGSIRGFDPQISGPVQTAYPQNYGGEKFELFGGMNLAGQEGWIRNHRVAFEIGAPVYQRLNGPQLQTSWTAILGWQYSF